MSKNEIPKYLQSQAVAYVRVSSKEQEKEGFSIPAQHKLLQNYAAERSIRILKTFEDVETAKQSGRTGFAEMLLFFENDPAKPRILLVEKTDRLYRNIKDWVHLDERKLEIHFVKENVIISPDSRSSEKFLHGIKVLMAKNYIDNLSEEVKKGMREKAEQGHWPTVAPIGYVNNLEIHRIEPDPDRANAITKMFDWYATGNYSLQQLTEMAASAGLTHPRSGRRLSKSEIHRALHNPIYYGDFNWNGRYYIGKHQPLISRDLFEKIQDVFGRSNRPKRTKRDFPFNGLLTCGLCGCAMTAEIKKGQYVYYHCTGYRGKCGNDYIRQENLSELLGDIASRIEIDHTLAEKIAAALRESHASKKIFQEEALNRLQSQYAAIQTKISKAYDDKLEGRISEDFWKSRHEAWQRELELIRSDMARHERANDSYIRKGIEILELAKQAHSRYLKENDQGRRRMLNALLSNCAYKRGSLSPTYNKPFDLLVNRAKKENWLGDRDSNPDQMVQSHPSYH
jgi:site-specific DNA recombinase